jgi:hypothetical protein
MAQWKVIRNVSEWRKDHAKRAADLCRIRPLACGTWTRGAKANPIALERNDYGRFLVDDDL